MKVPSAMKFAIRRSGRTLALFTRHRDAEECLSQLQWNGDLDYRLVRL